MAETFTIRQIKDLLDEAISNGLGDNPAYVRLGKDNRKDIKFIKYEAVREGNLEIICEGGGQCQKQDEWHYVKNGLPKEDGTYLFYLFDKEDTLDYFCEVLDITDTENKPFLESHLWDIDNIIAWKEIVPPEEI